MAEFKILSQIFVVHYNLVTVEENLEAVGGSAEVS